MAKQGDEEIEAISNEDESLQENISSRSEKMNQKSTNESGKKLAPPIRMPAGSLETFGLSTNHTYRGQNTLVTSQDNSKRPTRDLLSQGKVPSDFEAYF